MKFGDTKGGGGGKKQEESKKFYVDVRIKTDQSDNAEVTVNGNRSLAFQTCSKFHTYCVVVGRTLVIEFFSLPVN